MLAIGNKSKNLQRLSTRPFRPFPQPVKHLRYPWISTKEQQMTIVAGFHVMDGIVLCGDTMYTGGMKLHQSKLVGATLKDSPNPVDHLSVAFALAGHEGNARMAIEDCIDGMSECQPEKRTYRKITRILRSAILGINRVCDRLRGPREAARAMPPFSPPSRPKATAWGFLGASAGGSVLGAWPVASRIIWKARALGSFGRGSRLFDRSGMMIPVWQEGVGCQPCGNSN
jgi:hypothetical protein